MKIHFFNIPAKWPEQAQQLLNTFCEQHRVMTLEKNIDTSNDSGYAIRPDRHPDCRSVRQKQSPPVLRFFIAVCIVTNFILPLIL